VRVRSFSVCFEKTDRIMSIFLCVFTRTEKSSNFSVGFRIFLSGFLKRTKKLRMCIEKHTQKNVTPTEVFKFPVVTDIKEAISRSPSSTIVVHNRQGSYISGLMPTLTCMARFSPVCRACKLTWWSTTRITYDILLL